MTRDVEIDYCAVPPPAATSSFATTDGVHDHVDGRFVAEAGDRRTDAADLDAVARAIVGEALARGSKPTISPSRSCASTTFPPAMRPR